MRIAIFLAIIVAAGICSAIVGLVRLGQIPIGTARHLKHPCLPTEQQKVVQLERKVYYPSELELRWLNKSHHGIICSTSRTPHQAIELWLNYSEDIFFKSGRIRLPSAQEAEVLSSFDWGDGKIGYIEPLHGSARSPRICEYYIFSLSEAEITRIVMDLSFIITENFCSQSFHPKPRAKFYDLGCVNKAATLKFNWEAYNYTLGSGRGPSIPLFYSMYKSRCIEFDDIYAWEAQVMEPDLFWSSIPDHFRHKVRFFNVPVVENPCPETLSGNFAERGSFLRLLLASASVKDFVVVKVDIDGGPELEILETIAQRPELFQLVDEIYFEYHFEFDFNFGWGNMDWQGRTVDTAINLMYRLRQVGIRAHFWI